MAKQKSTSADPAVRPDAEAPRTVAMLASIAARLVHAADDELHVAIDASLRELCETVAADCGAAIFYAGERPDWEASRSWSRAPDRPLIAPEDPLPPDVLGWLREQVMSAAASESSARTPVEPDAPAIRSWLQARGIASALGVRLAHGGETLGYALVGRARQDAWHADERDALCDVADLLATAHERRRLHLQMSRRLQFESLVGEVASSLLRTPANLLDAAIEDALRRLAEYMPADRAAIVLLSADGRRLSISHEFCGRAVALRETLQDLPVEGFVEPWRFSAIPRARVIKSVRKLPDSADQTRSLLDAFGIESALGVPLVLGSEVVGAMVFGRAGGEPSWDEREAALLRACGDIIITTIQRLRIERALRESDEKFSRTFLAMPDAVTISEIDSGVIVEANPAFESTSGFATRDVLGKSSLAIGFWTDPQQREELVRDVQHAGVVRNREVVMRHATGRPMNILLSAVRVELRGRPYLCTVMRDVTEAKAAERALRSAQSALRELNLELEERVRSRTAELESSLRELESFSYSVSHDLRSPLRGINGFASLLAEDYGERLDDTGRDYLKRIASATVRMGDLIDELLDLARISRVPMRKAPIDLAGMCRLIVGELHEIEPGRRLEATIAASLPAVADHGLMRVAVSNLIGNAWKFTGNTACARIEIGVRTVDGERQYFVRDNGAGFDMTNSALLFRPFSRLHRPSEFPGTGIGLATVARIVQRHGGRVWAEGSVGRGATFYFTLA